MAHSQRRPPPPQSRPHLRDLTGDATGRRGNPRASARDSACTSPAAGPSRTQRSLIIALGAIVVLLLMGIAFLVGQLLAHKPTPIAVVGSPAPTPAASASPAGTPSPGGGGPLITSAGTLLQSSSGSDTGSGRGNGPGCQIWVDTGWTLGDCNLVPVNGKDNAAQSIAYVTEHKAGASGVQWRVFIMTTSASEGFWHTKLYYSDEMGGGFTSIAVKAVDTTGGGLPDLVVGFRHNKTSGSGTVLDYDIVMRSSATAALQIVAHRQVADGSVVFGPGVTDYDSSPGPQFTKSVLAFRNGGFHIGSTSQVAPGSVPASQLP